MRREARALRDAVSMHLDQRWVCPDCPVGADARRIAFAADVWLHLLAAALPFVVALAAALLVLRALDRHPPGGS
jgi:hypothetical protein